MADFQQLQRKVSETRTAYEAAQGSQLRTDDQLAQIDGRLRSLDRWASRDDRQHQAQRQALEEKRQRLLETKARGEATRTITEAEGYAVERVNRANGEATRFRAVLEEYQRAPQVTRRRLYLEAVGAILPEAKALYIVDGDQKALVPWLPLESGGRPATGGAKP